MKIATFNVNGVRSRLPHLLLWLERRHEVPGFVFILVILHCLVLVYGGAYTYARVPLGVWMQDWFGFARNDYDKIGHFMQGFVPALIAREVLVRSARLDRRYLGFLCICVSLAISAVSTAGSTGFGRCVCTGSSMRRTR